MTDLERELLEALKYHQEQTRPIQRSIDSIASADSTVSEPDLSSLSDAARERIRKWIFDGTFVERAIGVIRDQERELMAYEKVFAVPLTDEQDRALCEAYFNDASDEYFKARPAIDSAVNRRIFYAGHRKAWITHDEAVKSASGIGEKS